MMSFTYSKKRNFEDSSNEFEESANKAWEHLNKTSTKLFSNFSKDKTLLDAFSLSTQKKEPLYIKKGLSTEQIESIYSLGLFFYKKKIYEKSFSVFRVMAYLDYSDIRGWKGLAASLCALKKHLLAQKIYLSIFKQHPEDLETLFELAKCYASLNDFPKAEQTLDKIISLSSDKPNYKNIRKQAFRLKALLPL